MLFFDAGNDLSQYYARIGDATFKLVHNLNFEEPVRSLSNKMYALQVSRESQSHELFAPHYMNAFLISFNQGAPFEIVFDMKDIEKGTVMDSHTVYEKNGRVIIKSTSQDNRKIYTAIQGDKLLYEVKENTQLFTMNLMSRRVAVAVVL